MTHLHGMFSSGTNTSTAVGNTRAPLSQSTLDSSHGARSDAVSSTLEKFGIHPRDVTVPITPAREASFWSAWTTFAAPAPGSLMGSGTAPLRTMQNHGRRTLVTSMRLADRHTGTPSALPESCGSRSWAYLHRNASGLKSEQSSGRFHGSLNMNYRLALVWGGALLVGAVLAAQTPADFEASRDFEASVRAAMAPSIVQQRAAIRKQVSAFVPAGVGPSVSPSARPSFFAIPFSLATEGAVDCDPLPAEQLDPLIEEAAQKTGVEAQLVRAVIEQESAGRPCALSARGAEGLMQLMPATAEEFDVDDPFDPKQNVEAGAKLLKSLLERYKNDPTLALGAYNSGSGRVDQEGGVPPIPETVDYVAAILDKLRSVPGKTNDGKTESSPGTPTK
jgi:hypothetical protein